MKRALIYGFCDNLFSTPQVFKERGVLDPIIWIADHPEATHRIYKMDKAKWEPKYYGGHQREVYEQVQAHMGTYLDMATRDDYLHELSVHDYFNMFNRTFDYVYHLLTANQIELVWLNAPPHANTNFMLYIVAKCLGIETLMVYQSLFPNKFLFFHDLEDFGYFNGVKAIAPYEHHSIEKRHEKEIFYMANIPKTPYKLQDFFYWKKKKKLLAFIRKYKLFKEYRKRLSKSTSRDFSLDTPYVYFPLHLQPEMTTSAIGGKYWDQLLAIEHLSEILPEGWQIYVKENPKQSEIMRGEQFFQRLWALPNVTVVPTEVNTHLLTRQSQFVATLTGTVGWEAISGGKNVLAFGRPWYLTLPGVFEYNEQFRLEDLLNYQINHDELEKRFSELCQKMGTGIVDQDYKAIQPDYTPDKNTHLLADFLKIITSQNTSALKLPH